MSHATCRGDHCLSWGVGKLFVSALHKGGDHCGSGFTEGDNVCSWLCQGVGSALPPLPQGRRVQNGCLLLEEETWAVKFLRV